MNPKKHPLRFYVYAYLRDKDSLTAKAGTPYYIGKGQGDRAWGSHYNNTTPKNFNNIVILEKNLSEVGAFALERRYIAWYGRKHIDGGILINLTLGGEGSSGHKRSKISIEKQISQIRGENHWTYGKERSIETKKKISKSLLGTVISKEIKDKISKTTMGDGNHMYGKKHTQEAKEKMSKSQLGRSSGPWSEERKKKARERIASSPKIPMSEITKEKLRKPQEKIVCPHCGKTGGASVMKRHHFDRCKSKITER
jgi:hypothetical protein